MTAGRGYKLYVKRAGTLAVSGTQTRAAFEDYDYDTERTRGMSCPWTSPTNYANSMTLDAVVFSGDATSFAEPGSAVGVFDANGNCRGVAFLRTTAWGTSVYSGQVWSDKGTEQGFTMKFWDAATDEISTIEETIDFLQDSLFGSALAPKSLHVSSAKVDMFTYALFGGWNLITPTLVLEDESINGLIAAGALVYNDATRTYSRPSRADLVPGTALWLFCSNSKTLTLYGNKVQGWTPPTVSGCTIVGVVDDIDLADIPGTTSAWEWTPYGYRQCTGTLQAGTAYWIYGE